ncbi:MAG: nucleotidyltransferase family protein [Anaerolineaceae bacterium]|jgi:molybdenum cofactor cytidylyltransferase
MINHVAGVVLAAGESSRYGTPKQNLPWGKCTVLGASIHNAQIAGLKPIEVVLGAHAEAISKLLTPGNYHVIHNLNWKAGMGSSISAGVKSLPADTEGVILILADQPHISPLLIRSIKTEGKMRNKIIVPEIAGRRANPVYFPNYTFPELIELDADIGGRALFSRFEIHTLKWMDDSMAGDIDQPEAYQVLKELFNP